jgi:hypothetical protein
MLAIVFSAFDDNGLKFSRCECEELSCSPKVNLHHPQFSLGVQIPRPGLLALD